jgi:hypothetical protein
MTVTEILQSQLTDIFRIGMMVALVFTAERTRANTGMVIPILLGIAFIAVMIPMTMQSSAPEPLALRVGLGLVSNAIWVAITFAAKAAWQRMRG